MSSIEYERIWYLPTFLQDKQSPKCTLIGHIYQIRRSDMGNFNLSNKIDAWEFEDESALAEFIRKNRAVELPPEADGQPRYVPQRIKTRLNKLRGIGGSRTTERTPNLAKASKS